MKGLRRYALGCVIAVLAFQDPAGLLAQRETIPDAVARGAKGRVASQPSGRGPSMRDLLMTADLVVRGTVADSSSYLSDDKRDVYTDHAITNTTVLYRSVIPSSPQPGPPTPILVTQLGGSVLVSGITFTQEERGLPQIPRGAEGLFIAVHMNGKFHVAGRFLGAIEIKDGLFTPLTGRKDFASELRDVPVATALAHIQASLRELRKPNQ